MREDFGKASFGMDANLAAALSYLFFWVSGLIIYILEKENKFVRFHALQSVIVFASLFVLYLLFSFIPFLGWILLMPLGILIFVLWLILIINAANGKKFKLPIVGDIAEKNS